MNNALMLGFILEILRALKPLLQPILYRWTRGWPRLLFVMPTSPQSLQSFYHAPNILNLYPEPSRDLLL